MERLTEHNIVFKENENEENPLISMILILQKANNTKQYVIFTTTEHHLLLVEQKKVILWKTAANDREKGNEQK